MDFRKATKNKGAVSTELKRLIRNAKQKVPLEKWGPYLSSRQWGTVREDYSADGMAWQYFPHDHARSRVYRWGEDGIGGISDINQLLCFALAFWNGRDPILKERLFGLSNPEGNHGEDVKELYYYLDNLPTHYYMKYLYKYPQAAYPYDELIEVNKERGRGEPEYELLDTGIFNENKYFDIYIEYAKENSEDIFIKINAVNRGRETAALTILPTIWFFNFWQFGYSGAMPLIENSGKDSLKITHPKLGTYYVYFTHTDDVLFTENETNTERLFGKKNASPFVKDAFHDGVIKGENFQALKDKMRGTKCAPVYHADIAAGGSFVVYLRLTNKENPEPFPEFFDAIFDKRRKEADEFYGSLHRKELTADQQNIQRQAFAGMLWNKQFYHYDVEGWLYSDDGITPKSPQRTHGRNADWKYLKNRDILSMPDNWEYPWYAAWDMAFHCITMALIDPVFAKHQLNLLLREWYMNPQGQLPAYEWNFSDVNPPVHAFAALQIYKAEEQFFGEGDLDFLKEVFQKLLINFTWWTNRKDQLNNSVFEGGFLGLDNIGLFDRNMPLPDGTILEQADGTSWMGMYALDMMNIALQIAIEDPSFENSATKFYEHFVIIAQALNVLGLWNEKDQFYYDYLSVKGRAPVPMEIRTIVGLTPLFAVSMIDKEVKEPLADFAKRVTWLQEYRRQKNLYLPSETKDSADGCTLLSLVNRKKLETLLQKIFDESEFLSPGGIRAVSKYYEDHPYSLNLGSRQYSFHYTPGNSDSGLFGGNSNWRGPVWMPINYLLLGSLRTFGTFYGDSLKVEFPTGSGNQMTLNDACTRLKKRLLSIFEKDSQNNRPVFGNYNWFYSREENRDLVLFHEYFHGDTREGLGASHQTGWTGLIANLIQELEEEENI